MNSLNKIKEVLKLQDQTQSWLSEKIGVSRNSISKWCNNEIQPSLSDLDKIADALNIDIFNLITSKNTDIHKFAEYKLKFLKPYSIPSLIDGVFFFFPYTINERLLYGMQIGITGQLALQWGFPVWQLDGRKENLLIRTLFHQVKKHLENKIKNRNLKDVEKHTITTSNTPNKINFNPQDLYEPEGQLYNIKINKEQVNVMPYINEPCKFYMLSGDVISGFMLTDEFEDYFIVKNINAIEYQQEYEKKNIERMKELRFYPDLFEIINIETLQLKRINRL